MKILLFLLLTAFTTYSFDRHSDLVGPFSKAPVMDCTVRRLAYEFAQHLGTLPGASASMGGSFSTVFDALRLGIDCNATLSPAPNQNHTSSANLFAAKGTTFYVDPNRGNDKNDGSLQSPFLSIGRALVATRAGSQPGTIILRNGTFYLYDTITLTEADSGLSIISFSGETPVLSAGAPLVNLKWTPVPNQGNLDAVPPMTGPFIGSLLETGGGAFCISSPGSSNPGVCVALGQTNTAAECETLCLNNDTCTGYTWHDNTQDGYSYWCYARVDGYELNDGAPGHVCGWKTVPLNVWVATLPPSINNFDTLFINNRRAVRARWPNGNPEIHVSPIGWATAAAWLPPRSYPPPSETHITSPSRKNDPYFPQFQWGTGGTVANFTTGNFWGTKNPPYGSQYQVPSGLVLPTAAPSAAKWTHTERAVVQAFHGGLWGGWQFRVQSVSSDGKVTFSEGGWQEARGLNAGAGFYIENIKDLIDAPGEWYFDPDTHELTVFFNGTVNNTDLSVSLVVSQLETAILVDGAKGVTLSGLTIAHTLTDYMLPFTVPSGGDWSYHDGGALKFTNTQNCVVGNSVFYSTGGNGVMVSGSNRNTLIIGNEFVWTGASAIVTAGLNGNEMQPKNYPEGTHIIGNHAHETGIYVKQSGGLVYMGLSANATVSGNVFYNSPRAGINVNDGFGGGHVISNNLAFNHVRETSDHGNFNSWDRQPYIWQSWNASNLYPATTYISHNFFINNYRSRWPIDHDDGSNNYEDSFNFLPWGGSKSFLGFNKRTLNNLFLYSDYSPVVLASPKVDLKNGQNVCGGTFGTYAWGPSDMGQWDTFASNLCIVSTPAHFYQQTGCNPGNPLDGNTPILRGNTFASDIGGYVLQCGSVVWNLSQAQSVGLDVGSTVMDRVPTIDEIKKLVHVLLNF